MTTPAADRLYQAQHMHEHEFTPNEVFNPYNKPLSELPMIYGFNNGGSPGWMDAVLIAEDGTWLGGHICSNECYMPYDLGVLKGSRPDRHEGFQKHYPSGYKMEFVSYEGFKTHDKLKAACAIAEAKEPKE